MILPPPSQRGGRLYWATSLKYLSFKMKNQSSSSKNTFLLLFTISMKYLEKNFSDTQNFNAEKSISLALTSNSFFYYYGLRSFISDCLFLKCAWVTGTVLKTRRSFIIFIFSRMQFIFWRDFFWHEFSKDDQVRLIAILLASFIFRRAKAHL